VVHEVRGIGRLQQYRAGIGTPARAAEVVDFDRIEPDWRGAEVCGGAKLSPRRPLAIVNLPLWIAAPTGTWLE